jgi:long-chain fatty acid transport protein
MKRMKAREDMKTMKRVSLAGAVGALVLAVPGVASATNSTEFPDNGSEQMARGGAWVARASDPLAAFYNPAGLAGQDTRVLLNANINILKTCFTRQKSAFDTTQEPLADPTTGRFPKVCNETKPFFNPQLAFTYRASDRVGIGIAVLGPSGVGDGKWPAFVDNASGPQAAPQRYLIVNDAKLLFFTPTIGVGVEVVDNLRLGASLQWGIMKGKFATSSAGLNDNNQSPRANDVQATLIVADYFVPGFTLGALYTPVPQLDVAGWFKWSDSIKASGDVYTQANYYTPKVASGDGSGIKDGDTSLDDCGFGPAAAGTCKNGGNAKLKLNVPMEAKIGVRFHQPRAGVEPKKHSRNPMAEDVFDAEMDLTWANNSANNALELRFPGDANGNGLIPVNGTGGNIPPIGDIPRGYKDVFGVRIGGDVNVLPDQLALRTGAFWESKGQDTTYQNIDFAGASKLGIAVGATYRVRLDKEKTRALEFSLGFMHVFYATQKNDDPNNDGVHGLAGTPCNPTTNSQPGNTCSDGRQKYRTNWPINLGEITNALNVLNVGASYRF